MNGPADAEGAIASAIVALGLFALVIWFLVWVLTQIISMLHRKGRSGWNILWLLLGPLGFLVLLVIASQPDRALLDELSALREMASK